MKHLIIAAALALTPSLAFADHNHGGHGQGDAHGAAQTMLSASTPSDGAVLAESPRTLALTFAHPVALRSVAITGPSGRVNTGFRSENAAASNYSLLLPAGLASGAYEARWTAASEDHQMSGIIRFTVQ